MCSPRCFRPRVCNRGGLRAVVGRHGQSGRMQCIPANTRVRSTGQRLTLFTRVPAVSSLARRVFATSLIFGLFRMFRVREVRVTIRGIQGSSALPATLPRSRRAVAQAAEGESSYSNGNIPWIEDAPMSTPLPYLPGSSVMDNIVGHLNAFRYADGNHRL